MGEQIGPGVYASPTRDEYNIGVGDRWCVENTSIPLGYIGPNST